MTSPPFNATTDASTIASFYSSDIKTKTIIVTGVSPNGLGAAACEAIAPHDPRLLIITGRSLARPKAVAGRLLVRFPELQIRVVVLNLESSESVKQAAAEIQALSSTIDVLINNAGVMCIPEHTKSPQGTEMHLAVNHLGPFLLTQILHENLLQSASGGRVVNLSSSANAASPFRFSDPNFEDESRLLEMEVPLRDVCDRFAVPYTLGYSPFIAYAQSKTAGALHASALAQQYIGRGIQAFSVNPGVIDTGLWRHMPKEEVSEILKSIPTKTQGQGAATILVAAFDSNLSKHPGAYFEDCAIASAAPHTCSEDAAQKLWEWSLNYSGENWKSI